MTFNIIDLALGCILALSVCFSRGLSFLKELIKSFGALLATVITLHYFIPLGNFLKHQQVIFEPLNYLMAFIVLTAFVIFLFALVAEGWLVILKIELPPQLDRWGSWIFSLIRIYMVFGLIYVAVLVSSGSVSQLARGSFSSASVGQISLWIYQGFFEKVVKNILPNEAIRQEVVDLIVGHQAEKEKPVENSNFVSTDL